MIRIRVPATMANLGPGFDTFGLAVSLYNDFSVTPAEKDALSIAPATTVETGSLPPNPQENILFKAMEYYAKAAQWERPPIEISVEAHIPLARGLGSSSTAVVAGLMAAHALSGEKLPEAALLRLAAELEGHPDNVAPALLGSVVFCDGNTPYTLPWPSAWKILAVIPNYEVVTEKARHALPKEYPLQDAIFNVRKASLLTYALLKQDAEAFAASLEDRLHQPYRGLLIPEFLPVKEAAIAAGAYGTIISGSGSTIGVFYDAAVETFVQAAVHKALPGEGVGYRVLSLTADLSGSQIL